MIPPKQDLEKKRWYRSLKVVSIIYFLLICGASIIAFAEFSPRRIYENKTVCKSGREYSSEELAKLLQAKPTVALELIKSGWDTKDAMTRIICDGREVPSSLSIHNVHSEKNYKTIEVYRYSHNWLVPFGVFLGIVGAGIALLWGTRQALLYIIYGKY